jgi:hypothetical protein
MSRLRIRPQHLVGNEDEIGQGLPKSSRSQLLSSRHAVSAANRSGECNRPQRSCVDHADDAHRIRLQDFSHPPPPPRRSIKGDNLIGFEETEKEKRVLELPAAETKGEP